MKTVLSPAKYREKLVLEEVARNGFSSMMHLSFVTGIPRGQLEKTVESLAARELVTRDGRGRTVYAPVPF